MNVLIVDDESKARSLLSTILKESTAEVTTILEASTLLEGVEVIKNNKIDVLFLDIEMPQHSGLELFDFISVESVNFEIIFTTAYSEYAIKAFEFNALDYLLKPISFDRFKKALLLFLFKELVNHVN